MFIKLGIIITIIILNILTLYLNLRFLYFLVVIVYSLIILVFIFEEQIFKIKFEFTQGKKTINEEIRRFY